MEKYAAMFLSLVLSVCLAQVLAQTGETGATDVVDVTDVTGENGVTVVTTTLKPTTGPDDLTSTDYIIIGVFCAVALLVTVGGTVFCCLKAKEEAKEKEDLYNRYLQDDQLNNQRGGGRSNQGYRA